MGKITTCPLLLIMKMNLAEIFICKQFNNENMEGIGLCKTA